MASSRRSLKDHLSCPKCLEVLRDPVTIPCGHSYCKCCIQDFWNKEETQNGIFYSCPSPTCNETFSIRPSPTPNIILADMIKGIKTSTSGNGTGAEGKRRPASSSQAQGWATPTKRLRITGTPTAHCRTLESYGFKSMLAGEARNKYQKELQDRRTKYKQRIQKIKKDKKDLLENIKEIRAGSKAADEHCEGIVAMLIDSLQNNYSTVREVIRAQERAAVGRAESRLERLELGLTRLTKRDAELDQLSLTDDNEHFLQRWRSLSSFSEADDLSTTPEDPHLPYMVIKRAVKDLVEKLEAFCKKEIINISLIETNIGSPPHSSKYQVRSKQVSNNNNDAALNPEPKTRPEFLQYACELTLDPNTAHEDLSLSEEDTMVRWDPKKLKDSVLRHPERFTHRRQVLCKEGLQAEHCYWEVEVVGDKAEIALTYKRIKRKSKMESSAFGGNKISWSLDLSKGYSVSHHSQSVLLEARPSQSRIGVYLKFKEGTLTFYEVSDNMRFLYKTQQTTFSEPLYPGFWLGEKSYIRLCDLRHEKQALQ